MTTDMLSFDPAEVAVAERGWDDQHLYLRGARTTVETSSTVGFTAAVRGSADSFAAAWARHAGRLAGLAEAEADGIRSTMARLLVADLRGRRRAGFLAQLNEAVLLELLRERR